MAEISNSLRLVGAQFRFPVWKPGTSFGAKCGPQSLLEAADKDDVGKRTTPYYAKLLSVL